MTFSAIGTVGARSSMRASTSRIGPTAGRINSLWNAPATFRRIARILRSFASGLGALDRGDVPADHDLHGGVLVRDHQLVAVPHLVAEGLGILGAHAEEGAHRPRPHPAGELHRGAARDDELQGGGQIAARRRRPARRTRRANAPPPPRAARRIRPAPMPRAPGTPPRRTRAAPAARTRWSRGRPRRGSRRPDRAASRRRPRRSPPSRPGARSTRRPCRRTATPAPGTPSRTTSRTPPDGRHRSLSSRPGVVTGTWFRPREVASGECTPVR